MADFLVEVQGFEANKESDTVVTDPIKWWHTHTDRSSKVVGSRIGVFLIAPSGLVFELLAKLEEKKRIMRLGMKLFFMVWIKPDRWMYVFFVSLLTRQSLRVGFLK